ncbi:L-lactate permease [Neisseria gonorrhoeae]|uniref:L-lactate permease n=1 Tax=Neisseria gonorrhoeae TaxID=485 RepID=A0A378VVV8_NEIGO|nr:L-lactate permease [Neisseria gonorrhoeae]
MGALIMVQLMLVGGDNSMVKIIGKEFAAMAGEHWVYFSPYLGAIGAFFSGSNTVSNLTFGPIQQQIALDTGLSVTLILALQSVGGAMGNMVCLNNIIAVCTVLDVKNSEGAIIKKTVIPMAIYGVIAVVAAMISSSRRNAAIHSGSTRGTETAARPGGASGRIPVPEQPAPPNKCRLKPEKASDGILSPFAFRRSNDAASCRQGGSACRNTGRQRCPILLRPKVKHPRMPVPLLVVRSRAIQRQIFRQHGNFLRIQIVHLIFLCVVGVRPFYAIGRLKDISAQSRNPL